MPENDPLPFELTLAVRDTCLCLHVRRAARALPRRYDEALKPVGLTNGQFSLMMALNRPNAPSMGDVSALLAMDRTTLTANLKPLVRRALVAVADDPSDRRSRLMTLTATGRIALAAAVPLWREAQAVTERLITQSDPEALRAGLKAVS